MRARDLATSLPVVDRTTPVIDAVRLIADTDLLGLAVADRHGHPAVLVSSLDIARLMLPDYVRGDPSLANVLGEAGVTDLRDGLAGRTVGDLVDDDAVTPREVVTVPGGAHLVEIVTRMVAAKAQVALVHDPERSEPGFVTLPAVFDAIVAAWGDGGRGDGTAAIGDRA